MKTDKPNFALVENCCAKCYCCKRPRANGYWGSVLDDDNRTTIYAYINACPSHMEKAFQARLEEPEEE